MRFIAFLFGVIVGVGGAAGYLVFVAQHQEEVAPVVRGPDNPPLVVTFGEGFINELLQKASLQAPGIAVPAGSLIAELGDDIITVRADVQVAGQPSKGSAKVRPVVQNGVLAIEVVETSLGALPLPALKQILDEHVNTRLQQMFKLLPVQVTGVTVTRASGLAVSCAVDPTRLIRPLAPPVP